MNDAELIYDWNKVGPIQFDTRRKVTLDDETLRDGLQNPSVIDPPIGEKIEILHLMEALGIEMVNIGLPGAGPRAYADTEALAKEIARSRMKIRPNCAARTHENDIRPIVEISESSSVAIEASTFLGSSPIRRLVEDWSTDYLQRTVEHAVSFAVGHGLAAMFVTEDTARAPIRKRSSVSTRRRSAAALLLWSCAIPWVTLRRRGLTAWCDSCAKKS